MNFNKKGSLTFIKDPFIVYQNGLFLQSDFS